MTDMIEKVARALCGESWGAKSFTETSNGCEPEEEREWAVEQAKKAITAMLEPTGEMITAQIEAAWPDGEVVFADEFYGPEPQFEAAWKAAIQQALKE